MESVREDDRKGRGRKWGFSVRKASLKGLRQRVVQPIHYKEFDTTLKVTETHTSRAYYPVFSIACVVKSMKRRVWRFLFVDTVLD